MSKPIVQTYSDYNYVRDNSYTIPELKEIGKRFSLKFKQKKKKDMSNELYNFLRNNYCAKKIQKIWNKYFICMFNASQGPARIKRELCNNVEDFLTTETVKEIDYYFFISYKDTDGFIYGFNLISIHNLIIKRDTKNPYTRNAFSVELIELVQNRINYNKILNKVHHEIQDQFKPCINSKIISAFQKIDQLDNYTQAEWLLDLSHANLRRFILELYDIWDYRAQLSRETKVMICPPNGMPFRDVPMHIIQTQYNINISLLKQFSLIIINNFINSSPLRDNQKLGAIYILSALTLVNPSAAESMPWLYRSVL
jgi:hypothetical protein